ncbi:hypothetical protein EDM56_10370 [Brevibacillus fluminis]|uniref:Uncharacterized protein n=1 Tax=Brevibacillus fluminis TaxID=511487 RepID=A0A3M8DND5_9BACL|nr:hypothetical protein [Brevibacillus fluminis]RNB89586.1 hypothetical protein EDM56_10370 [Brevibacillus fluminis]
MACLEYRLLDEHRHFPVLYYYPMIDKDEVSLRFACDYLVKDRKVFEKTSCAIEENTYVIYVKPADDEDAYVPNAKSAAHERDIVMEVREFHEDYSSYPVIGTYRFHDDDDALLHLQSDYLYLNGREWAKSSTEIDEDRMVYVYYAIVSG